MKIDSKYKTYSRGTYNKGVDVCPFCGNKMSGKIFENCIGIADDAYGEHVMIIVCNECFESFYFHCNKHGKNIFFNDKHEDEIL